MGGIRREYGGQFVEHHSTAALLLPLSTTPPDRWVSPTRDRLFQTSRMLIVRSLTQGSILREDFCHLGTVGHANPGRSLDHFLNMYVMSGLKKKAETKEA